MIWNTEPFAKAHSSLLSGASHLDLSQIEKILSPIKGDLLQLLNTPAKSESSRSTLAKKVVNIDGEEIEFNDAFLNDAAHVADELGLDELVAAKLTYYSIEDSKRLGNRLTESAILLFFVRRQYIIDIIRFCLEVLPESKMDLILKPSQRVEQLFNALKSVEKSMNALNDKLKTGEFMGMTENQDFQQLLKLQRFFYVKEHESLGNCLQAYLNSASSSETSATSVKLVLDHVATFDVFDSRLLSYAPGLVTWLSKCTNTQFREAVWNYFNDQSRSNNWKLPFWRAAIEIVFYASLVNEEVPLPDSIHFDMVMDLTRHAIDDGGFEFWMSFAQDMSSQHGETRFDMYRPLVRSRVPRLIAWQALPSTLTQENIQHCLNSVVINVIANMADILKEMRLSEEDMYLAMNELAENTQTVSPGMDLERFFLLVAIVFHNQPEASRAFFEDDGNALYGFLVWGSDCRVTLMAATFAEVIAALANNDQNGESVYQFLNGSLLNSNSSSSSGFLLSWTAVLSFIDHYIISNLSSSSSSPDAKLSGRDVRPALSPAAANFSLSKYIPDANNPNRNLSSGVSIDQASTVFDFIDPNSPIRNSNQKAGSGNLKIEPFVSQSSKTLSEDTLLVLSAYLHLIERTATYCKSSREFLRGKGLSHNVSVSEQHNHEKNNQKDVVNLLLKLLKMKIPITASIFSALCPFASSEMWPMLDSVIINKFDEVLQSIPDALSFVQLIVNLSELDDVTPRLNDYIHFVLKNILPWATQNTVPTDPNGNLCVQIQLACLKFLKTLLEKSPTNQEAFTLCFESKVYESIFNILCVGIDKFTDLGSSHPLVESVTAAVKVVITLVTLSKAPTWSFDKPILYHLEVIPHVALYAGSSHNELSLLSINLLSLLNQCPEFMPTIGRQSRILSILSSTSEATRIRVGFMTRFDEFTIDHSIKISMLEMLTKELTISSQTTSHMSIAHYLLGFRQSELGLELELELDTGVGGIKSGNSLLTSICDTLLNVLISPGSNDKLLRLCSEVLGSLSQNPLTSEKVLDFLRAYDFWINCIKLEPLNILLTEDLIGYRAIMLEVWIREIEHCQKKMLLTAVGHYLNALVPIIFSLIDLNNIRGSNVELRCLSAWCKLVSTLIANKNSITGPTFVSGVLQKLMGRLPELVRQSDEFAVPLADLLVILFNDIQERGVDDAIARHSQQLFTFSLASIQPAQMNGRLRSYLYKLCCQCLKLTLQSGTMKTEKTSLKALTSYGLKIYQIACDDVLGFSSDSLKFDALVFLQMSAVLAHRLNSTFVASALLKYNFVSVFIGQVLAPLLNDCNTHTEATTKHQPEYVSREGEPSTFNILKACLLMLLPISQTRDGAADIFGSSLLTTIKATLPSIDDEVLSLLLQVLISMCISMGSDNHIVVEQIRSLIELHQTSFCDILQRDANLNRSLQDQNSESELPYLARNVTILVSLTGASLQRPLIN